MTTEKFDAIIIGAGLGGLSTAGYLAKAGKKVLVLEHQTVPGGYAHEFRRGKFRFEVALHAIDGAAPGGWVYPILSDLGVLDSVNFTRLDPFYAARFPEHEIIAPADPYEYEAELIRHFPGEADGIRRLIDSMKTVFAEVRRFTMDGQLNRRPPMTEMPTRYPNMLAAMSQSWGDFIGQYISDQHLQAVFSTLLGYYGLPPSQLNAATFILPWVSYHFFGAFYPEGGSMAMSRAIEATVKMYGGEVRYRQTVNRIEVRDGKAAAVVTENGLRVEADVIISNANAPDTMFTFVGRDHLPAKYIQQVEAALAKPAVSNIVVYLGLERDLLAEGCEHHEVFTFSGYDAEADYAAAKDGRFEDAGVGISHYNHADPTCAPDGCSVVSLFGLAYWDYADQWGTGGNLENYRRNPQYLELKEDAGDRLLAQAEKFIPGLREAIKYKEIATPLTNFRYTRNPGGSIYGSEQSVNNMYINRLNAETPIPNLFMTGAWVFGGGMSAAMLSGRSVAQMAGALLDGEESANTMQPEHNGGDGKQPSPPKLQNRESTKLSNQLDCHDTIAGMPLVFNPEIAGGLAADIQFKVSGDEPGNYYLRIENDACEFIEGASDNASLTINTPSDVWLAISRGELDGQMAFMQQKYKVQGDLGLLMKMSKMFKSG